MTIRQVTEDKKQYLSLLLLADEQEDMIDCYLERGTMYVLDDGGVKAECVVTDEGDGVLELKNIAVVPEHQRKGYARALVDFLVRKYAGKFSTLQVGTADSPATVPFYEKCGFTRSHTVPNFFTDHYDHPIYECGVQLRDMVYLQRPLIAHRSRPCASQRKKVISMVACVIVACGVALSVLLALRGQKEPTKTFDFEGFEEYKVEPLEYPNSMRLVYLVPYDADPEELYAHMQQAIESMREDVPDMYSAYVEYYEAPLFYENHNTPVADGVWGPRGSTIPLYGIEPGDYSQHIFTFHVYPYDADYALTEEEWALYQEILEYFLYEKGCQPYYIDPEDPYKYPDRVEEYRHLAERLGCSCETLMGLPNKVFLWRPSTVDCLPDNG